jgi:hypothetical protein
MRGARSVPFTMLLAFAGSCAAAASPIPNADAQIERARWVVGTHLAPPFVTRGDDGRYGGVAISRGDADALVHERVVLAHLLKELPARRVVLLPEGVAPFDYAFALPQGSPKREMVNLELLRLLATPAWTARLGAAAGKARVVEAPER